VDDYILAINGSYEEAEEWYLWFLDFYNDEYKLNGLGELKHALGLSLQRGEGSLELRRTKPIMELLEKFNMADALPAKYPMDKNFSLTSPAVPVPQKMFIVLFGALMFIGRVARPDILPALKRLGRFTANHDATHWEALKHILRYLKSNPDMPLTLNKGMGGALGKGRLTAMADSSHADCAMTRRSTSGLLGCSVAPR
jgi:hypothetical protein